MNKKKKIIYIIDIIVILLITSLTVFNLLKENPKEKLKAITNIGIVGILILLTVYLTNILIEGYITKLVIKSNDENIEYIDAIGSYCTGALFSNITPLKLGNAPSIVYCYTKSGLKLDKAIASFIEGNFIWVLNTILTCSVCMFFCYSHDITIFLGEIHVDLGLVALIGLIYNFLMLVICLLVAFNSFLQTLFIKGSSWVLLKLKRITDVDKYCKEQEGKLSLYRQVIKNFLLNFKESILVLFFYIVKNLIWGSVPYISYLLISKSGFDLGMFLYSFMLSQLIYYIGSIIPIPGASGAIEFSFLLVYNALFEQAYLVSTVLVWRTLTYFVPIVIGFVFFIKTMNKKEKTIQ